MRTRLLCTWIAVLALPACGSKQQDLPRLQAESVGQSTIWTAARILDDLENDGALVIETDNVVLDLGGHALLRVADANTKNTPRPDEHHGIGIVVRHAKNVTIRNGSVAGYKVGIRADNAPGLVLENVNASWNWRKRLESTPEESLVGDWLWPHYNENGEWESKYGGALSLHYCKDAVVRNCTANYGQNGLLLNHCRRCKIYDNDFRFNSGWGIAFYRTRHSEVSHNKCDHCVRGMVPGVYHVGNDSTGILIFEQSDHNVIANNSCTHCGNGIFMYAGHATTEGDGKGGSNHCLVIGNDFRFAVANGIEATFLKHNVYKDNRCSGSEHGIWAGYSSSSAFIGNECDDCARSGISIEHGFENHLERNHIKGGNVGIDLWWDPDPSFVQGVYGAHNNTTSSRNAIRNNEITDTKVALRLNTDLDAVVVNNTLQGSEADVDLGKSTRWARFSLNVLGGRGESIFRNGSGHAVQVSQDNQILGGADKPLGADVTWKPEGKSAWSPVWPDIEIPKISGTQDVTWTGPEGRKHIQVSPWGPLDPTNPEGGQLTTPVVFPSVLDRGVPTGKLFVGGSGAFTVTVEGDVIASITEGRAPTMLQMSAPDVPGVHPFTLTLHFASGHRVQASGSLLRVDWTVEFWPWVDDPLQSEDAYAKLVRTPAHVTETVTGLNYVWYGEGPKGLAPDRFATRATTTVKLPAGRYEVRSVSDDGIRVYVNDKRVIDNWTHHGPTPNTAAVELLDGEHTIRVEHFESNGWAHLSLALRRLK